MEDKKEIEGWDGGRRSLINNLFPNITNTRKRKYLIAYAFIGKIRQAARASRVDWTYHYKWLREDEEYKKAFSDAGRVRQDCAEEEIYMHGLEGHDEPVVYQGKISGVWVNKDGQQVTEGTPGAVLVPLTVKKYTPLLAIAWLNANCSEKYRPSNGNASSITLNADKMFIEIAARANKEIDITPKQVEEPEKGKD